MKVILGCSFLLFVIIYFSVKMAIHPVMDKQDEIMKEDFELVQLRDIDV